MSQNLPGRSPIGLPVTRRAASLADGIRKAQTQPVGPVAVPTPADPFPAPVAAPAAPAVGQADALRSRLVELFENSKITLNAFYQYSQTAAAIAEEYHKARLTEVYPGVKFEELTLAVSLDARETPATLDKKLAELHDVAIKKIVYDRVRSTYYLYV